MFLINNKSVVVKITFCYYYFLHKWQYFVCLNIPVSKVGMLWLHPKI
jgi:hypothetical protein